MPVELLIAIGLLLAITGAMALLFICGLFMAIKVSHYLGKLEGEVSSANQIASEFRTVFTGFSKALDGLSGEVDVIASEFNKLKTITAEYLSSAMLRENEKPSRPRTENDYTGDPNGPS